MRQHRQRMEKNHEPNLKVIHGTVPEENVSLSLLSHTAWTFIQSALWNSTQFSTREINTAKDKIAAYLRLYRQPRKGFVVFCQRVLLTRYYLNITNGRFTPLPSAWLDRANSSGFASTKGLYEDVKTIRDSLPAYKAEVRALAEAVLEFSEEPTEQNYLYWKNYFTERSTPGLLNLFQVFVTNFFFSI